MNKKKIFISSVQAGLPRPTFVQDDDFLLTIYRRTPQDTPQDTPQVTPQDTAQVTMQDNVLNSNKIDNSTMQNTMQVTMQVTPQVIRLYKVLGTEELTKQHLMTILGINNADYFRLNYLQPALQSGLIEMTIPDKPTSRNQKYRKTQLGKEIQL